MRLINAKTFQLEEFFADAIPPYAILSHTWGSNREEVTFAELSSGISRDKPSFQKIVHTCNQAKRDNLEYAWVDTCCI